MSPATIIMIVLICFGCALFLAGLVFVAVRAIGLVKAGQKAGISSAKHVEEIIRRSRSIEPKVRELMTKQQVVAETLQRVSATTDELNSLKSEIDRATGHLSRLRP